MKPNTRILSILIPVKNDQENILKSYESVQNILGDEIEMVVQDYKGLSRLRNCISDPNFILLEEDDRGTSQANNLSAHQANGKYLMFWGAGEQAILPDIMNAVEKLKTGNLDILFNCIRLQPFNHVSKPTPHNIELGMTCLTPGAMISKELFFRCGLYDMRYEIANDYAMFVNLLKATSNYCVTDDAVVDFPLNGHSTIARAFEGYMECEIIRMREYNKHPLQAAIDLIGTCQTYIKQHAAIDGQPIR